MNRCLLCWVVILCAISAPVWADAPAQDPSIPDSYKTDDASLANKDAIAGLISAEVDKLAKDDAPDAQSLSRDWLIAESKSSSHGYRDIYTNLLNQDFVTLLGDSKTSVRARVNAAIVTARAVANSPDNTNLLPATRALLKDQSAAVVLWAEQAAGSLVPNLLQGANAQDRQNLFSDMVQAAIRNSSQEVGGYIVELAYTVVNPVMKGLDPQAPGFPDLVDANLKLQQGRVGLYKNGVPQNPYADTFASQFLLDPKYWPQLNATQQFQAIQNMSDLIRLASGRAMAGGVPVGLLAELMRTVAAEGDCGQTLAKSLSNEPMTEALQAVAALSVASQPTDIKIACDKAYSALHDAFPNLQDAAAAQ
jgi:hypothetical protein